MNRNMILMLAMAGAAYAILNRAHAATAPAGSASAPVNNKNVNNQLWTSLLGGSWKALTDAQTGSGTAAFLKRNWLGQVTTSDGKPVGQEWQDLLPSTYMTEQPVDLSAPSSGVDYLTQLGW